MRSTPNDSKHTPPTSFSGDSALIRAISERHLDLIKSLLDHKANANCWQDEYHKRSALHWSVMVDPETSLVLLKHANNLNVNLQDLGGRTALHLAIAKGGDPTSRTHPLLIQKLMERTSLDLQDGDGNTPLHIAFLRREPEVIEELLIKNAPLDIKNQQGHTPMDMLGLDYDQVIKQLQKYPSTSPLDEIKWKNNTQNLLFLPQRLKALNRFIQVRSNQKLMQDLEINYTFEERESHERSIISGVHTALTLAACQREDKLIPILLEAKEDINYQVISFKNTALHWAIANANIKTALVLLNKAQGLNPDILDVRHKTALHLAIAKGRHHVTNDEMHKEADRFPFSVIIDRLILITSLNIKDEDGNTPLHIAIMRRDYESVKCLIEQKARLDVENKRNYQPGDMLYVRFDQVEKHLKAYTGNTFTLDSKTWNANEKAINTLVQGILEKRHQSLDRAIRLYSNPELIKTLRSGPLSEKDLRPSITAGSHTALTIASSVGDDQIVLKLLEAKEDVNWQEGWHKNTALLWAVANANIKTALVLLDNAQGLNPNLLDECKKTALHLAIAKGWHHVTDDRTEKEENRLPGSVIIKRLIPITSLAIKDQNGNTPLHIAFMRRDIEAIQALLEAKASLDIPNDNGHTPRKLLECEFNQVNDYLKTYARAFTLEEKTWQSNQQKIESMIGQLGERDIQSKFYDFEGKEELPTYFNVEHVIKLCDSSLTESSERGEMKQFRNEVLENKEYAGIVSQLYDLGIRDPKAYLSAVLKNGVRASNKMIDTLRGLQAHQLLNENNLHYATLAITEYATSPKGQGLFKSEVLAAMKKYADQFGTHSEIVNAYRNLLNCKNFNCTAFYQELWQTVPTRFFSRTHQPTPTERAELIARTVNSLAEEKRLTSLVQKLEILELASSSYNAKKACQNLLSIGCLNLDVYDKLLEGIQGSKEPTPVANAIANCINSLAKTEALKPLNPDQLEKICSLNNIYNVDPLFQQIKEECQFRQTTSPFLKK